jgi:hypothetical protein
MVGAALAVMADSARASLRKNFVPLNSEPFASPKTFTH